MTAYAPTDAAHVNETPKTEHEAGNVLTDAAQARHAGPSESAVYDRTGLPPVTVDAAQARDAALRGASKALASWCVKNIQPNLEMDTLLHALDAALSPALIAQNAALRAERDEWKAAATAHHSNPADHRYWEGRYRDEKARAEAAEAEVEKLRGALQIARVHVANNAEGWSVSRGAARDDLTIVDAALTTEADNG